MKMTRKKQWGTQMAQIELHSKEGQNKTTQSTEKEPTFNTGSFWNNTSTADQTRWETNK